MSIIPNILREEAQTKLTEALGNLRRDGEQIFFETHAEFIITASMLLGLLKLSNQLTARHREEMISKTLLAMCKAGEREIEKFEARMHAYQAALLGTPRQKFHFLASIRAHGEPQTKGHLLSVKVGAVHVRIARAFPKRAVVAFRSGTLDIDLQESKPFLPVWATVEARSESEAADKAISAIKSILGCINLVLNHNTERHHSGKRLPRNKVRLVGDQVVYRQDWSLFDEYFFYEEESDNPERWPVNLDKDLRQNRQALDRMLAKLNDTIFGNLLAEAAQDYHEALSRVDSALVHARLWSLLERLTNTQADESRATIRRASFLSTRKEFRRQRLKHAAAARHAFVHRRIRVPFIDELSNDLRKWAEDVLVYIFLVRRRFPSLDAFFRLLDAPHSKQEIERAMTILRIAKSLSE